MNSVQRSCVYAMMALAMCLIAVKAIAKDNVDVKPIMPVEKFQWHEHARLSWDDFKGPVTASVDESAAATCCSIGFKTNISATGGKPEIVVYNTFYANKSWVREDARIQSILDHEQGHFDLCEVYTRKLKERMGNIDLTATDMKQALMKIYIEVSTAYEARQQAYELETTHGTNLEEQKKWQDAIAKELM